MPSWGHPLPTDSVFGWTAAPGTAQLHERSSKTRRRVVLPIVNAFPLRQQFTRGRVFRRSLSWTLRILSSMSEGVCEWLIQRDREFLNVWASCGQ